MSIRSKLLASLILICLVFSPVASRAATPHFTAIYVFGDSYSDTGRGYVDSDGPTAVAYLAKRLGLDMVPSNAADAKGKKRNPVLSPDVKGQILAELQAAKGRMEGARANIIAQCRNWDRMTESRDEDQSPLFKDIEIICADVRRTDGGK